MGRKSRKRVVNGACVDTAGSFVLSQKVEKFTSPASLAADTTPCDTPRPMRLDFRQKFAKGLLGRLVFWIKRTEIMAPVLSFSLMLNINKERGITCI